mmetsp:Transcript_6468/g.16068  ORF Transcript_6468/g.16068 Transcript_6468/m.16068 type:complete len:211 (-) Transcript_6468:229-861(-)
MPPMGADPPPKLRISCSFLFIASNLLLILAFWSFSLLADASKDFHSFGYGISFECPMLRVMASCRICRRLFTHNIASSLLSTAKYCVLPIEDTSKTALQPSGNTSNTGLSSPSSTSLLVMIRASVVDAGMGAPFGDEPSSSLNLYKYSPSATRYRRFHCGDQLLGQHLVRNHWTVAGRNVYMAGTCIFMAGAEWIGDAASRARADRCDSS